MAALVLPLVAWWRVRNALDPERREYAAACAGVVVAGLVLAVPQSYLTSVGSPPTAAFWIAFFLLAALTRRERAGRITGVAKRRPRVLVLNQYYRPGVEATAHLLAELCEALTDEFDVTVVTGMVPGVAKQGRGELNGVSVVRVGSTAFDRSKLSLRALNYLTYLILSAVEGIRAPRPDVVMCMTDPPVIADVALVVAKRYRTPLVVVTQDVFPEVAVALKRLDNRALVLALRLATRIYLERADRVVAIGERMRERLEAKGADGDRVVVIPNWVNVDELVPGARDNAVGARARARRQVRRDALRQHRSCAGPRLARFERRRSSAISRTFGSS